MAGSKPGVVLGGVDAVVVIGIYGAGESTVVADIGALLEDLVISGDQPVRDITESICRWLGWL